MLDSLVRRIILVAAVASVFAPPVMAQSVLQNQVVVVDLERVFSDTLYGQRLQSDFRRADRALSVDFDRIAAELIAEEKELRDIRAQTEPGEFREMAEAFDAKSSKLRLEQAERRNKLNQEFQSARESLLRQLGPILSQLMRERGASILIQKDDQRMIVFPQADITQSAIVLIDKRLGNGLTSSEE